MIYSRSSNPKLMECINWKLKSALLTIIDSPIQASVGPVLFRLVRVHCSSGTFCVSNLATVVSSICICASSAT